MPRRGHEMEQRSSILYWGAAYCVPSCALWVPRITVVQRWIRYVRVVHAARQATICRSGPGEGPEIPALIQPGAGRANELFPIPSALLAPRT